jgi:hypothetical protein
MFLTIYQPPDLTSLTSYVDFDSYNTYSFLFVLKNIYTEYTF